MKRRDFITLLGGAAVSYPLSIQAQQPKKVRRIGVLWHAGSAQEEDVYLRVLTKAFNDLGYVEGKNIELEHRFPGMSVEIREPSGQRIACFCGVFPERHSRLHNDLRVLV